jgi:hypothetical protein
MSYEWRYINRQITKSSVSYTLLIEDTDNDEEISSYRIEKSFKLAPEQIDQEFLRTEAKKEIKRIIEETENPFVLPDIPIEVPVDDGSVS